MFDQFLTPDINATIEIDPILEKLTFQRDVIERIEDIPEQDKKVMLDSANGAITDHNNSAEIKPKLVIGYMPASKQTEFGFKLDDARKNAEKEGKDATLDVLELHRQICQWGIKGWNFSTAYSSTEVQYRGKRHVLASDDVVDVLERQAWLMPMVRAIMRYNDLQETSKKK